MLTRLSAEGIPDLKQTLIDMSDLAAIIDKYTTATLDADGNVVSRSVVAGQDAIAYKEFMDTLATYTSDYQNALSYSRIDNAKYAQAVYNSIMAGVSPSDTDLSLIESIAGKSFAGKLQLIGAQMLTTDLEDSWLDAENFKLSKDGNLVTDNADVLRWWNSAERNGSIAYADYITWAEKYNMSKAANGMTEADISLWNTLLANAKYGISGLTSTQ